MRTTLTCFLLSLLLLTACKRNEQSPLVAFFSDSHDVAVPIDAQRDIYITISVITNGVHVNKITLEANDNTYGMRTIKDTVPPIGVNDSRKINIKFTTPNYASNTMLTLLARVFTEEGDIVECRKYLTVKSSDIKWDMQESVTMYSAASGQKYAFSVPQMTVVFPETIDNDTLMFYDRASADEEQPQLMTMSWQSDKGLYFARFESLDFSNANIAAIEQAYQLTSRDNVITNLKTDDVIIYGTKTEVFGLIKILLVVDEEGSANDRYIFSIKRRSDFKLQQ
ncbi:MAG TPA: hypothetical protein DEO38_01065 [Bacteroidales bacterium]|jgi:hypothetical protein|nr:hypothetical protein [Bacteroidales bacterium]